MRCVSSLESVLELSSMLYSMLSSKAPCGKRVEALLWHWREVVVEPLLRSWLPTLQTHFARSMASPWPARISPGGSPLPQIQIQTYPNSPHMDGPGLLGHLNGIDGLVGKALAAAEVFNVFNVFNTEQVIP